MHCSNCESNYCKDCTLSLKKCLKCNTDNNDKKFVEIDKFLERHLDILKFKCPNFSETSDEQNICNTLMTYEEALQHLVECPLEQVFCPFDCYEQVQANLIQESDLVNSSG
jgi:hypothetical protein